MKAAIVLLLTLLAASWVIISMQPADAHNVAPRYNGASWGVRCLAPNPRMTPPVCCDFSRSYCTTACDLADESTSWKNACKANCQTAGQACHARVAPLPPVTNPRGTAPPATRY